MLSAAISRHHRPFALLFLIVSAGQLILQLTARAAEGIRNWWGADFSVYWMAGSRVLHGQSPYPPEQLLAPFNQDAVILVMRNVPGQVPFLYPPPFALIVSPLSTLPLEVATWFWVVISAAAIVVGCLLAARAGGMKLGIENVAIGIGLLCLAYPIYDSLWKGNVEGIETLMLGIGLAASPMIGSAATGLLGILKIAPLVTWPATFARGPRNALLGFTLVGVLLLISAPWLIPGWKDFPIMMINQLQGDFAHSSDNLAPVQIVQSLWPTIDLTAVVRLACLLLSGGLVVMSVLWARRPSGWPGALLAAMAASLLLLETVWPHYLTILAPFIFYAWPRLTALSRRIVLVSILGISLIEPLSGLLGRAPLIVFMFVTIILVLLFHFRPEETSQRSSLVSLVAVGDVGSQSWGHEGRSWRTRPRGAEREGITAQGGGVQQAATRPTRRRKRGRFPESRR